MSHIASQLIIAKVQASHGIPLQQLHSNDIIWHYVTPCDTLMTSKLSARYNFLLCGFTVSVVLLKQLTVHLNHTTLHYGQSILSLGNCSCTVVIREQVQLQAHMTFDVIEHELGHLSYIVVSSIGELWTTCILYIYIQDLHVALQVW